MREKGKKRGLKVESLLKKDLSLEIVAEKERGIKRNYQD